MDQNVSLRVNDISKQYRGGVLALRNISFQVAGGLTCLLGPNGAGKTTLMRILSTAERPTSGTLWWKSKNIAHEPNELRRTLGYLPQNFAAPAFCTAYQVVERLAAIKGQRSSVRKQRVTETLEIVGLHEVSEKKVGTFSGGMLRRLGIAQAIVHQPQVVIVDEPTAGLDPEERVRFRRLLADLARNRLVILSTHVVADVEAIADRMIVLTKGSAIYDASPDALINHAIGSVWLVTVSSTEFLTIQRDPRYHIVTATQQAEYVTIRLISRTTPPWSNAKQENPTLEEAYLVLVFEQRGEA